MKPTSERKLEWVEAGRGLAALSVVVSHAPVPKDYSAFSAVLGNLGVNFFFILSGFIIYHVHHKDIGQPQRGMHFLRRRFFRIFPTYWFVLLFALAVRQFLGNADYRVDVDVYFLLSQILLLPHDPFVGVAWTLRHELLFYGIFSALIFNRRIGLALFSIWFVVLVYSTNWSNGCAIVTLAMPSCPTQFGIPLLILPLNFYFFVGMAIGEAFQRGYIFQAALLSTLASVALLAIYQTSSSIHTLASSQFLGCSALVCWTVWASKRGGPAPALMWLGQISYSLYLIHISFLLIAHGLLKRAGLNEWYIQYLVGVVFALLAAAAISQYFEKPLLSAARKRSLQANVY
jgi:exopolysaccharide production protein ExoZ